MIVRVTFDPARLAPTNAALDVRASGARYAELLREALERELAGARIEVIERAGATEASASDADEVAARTAERTALDLAWVVRQMGAWAVVRSS